MRTMAFVTAASLAAVLSGCASTDQMPDFVVSYVKSTVDGRPDASRPHVVEAADRSRHGDRKVLETAEMTRWALRGAGLEVLPADAPRTGTETVVLFSFAAEPPVTTQSTGRSPIYSAPSSFSSRTVERIDGKGRKITETTYDPPTSAAYADVEIISSTTTERINKRGERITETTYTPRRSVVGYEDIPHNETRTPLRLTLKSFEGAALARQPALAKPVWTLDVTMTDGGLNPPPNLPYMLAAGQAHIGKQTVFAVAVTKIDDPAAVAIRNGGLPPTKEAGAK